MMQENYQQQDHRLFLFHGRRECNSVEQYGFGNIPRWVQTSNTGQLFNIFENNNFNEHYGTCFGYNFIVSKEIHGIDSTDFIRSRNILDFGV